MPSSNVELVQKLVGAYLSGDEETLRSMIGPGSEIHGAPGLINSGTYSGYEGFRQWVGEWEDAWEEISYELEEMIEFGDSIIVTPVHVVGRGAGSGAEIDAVFGWLYEFRDGKAVKFHTYVTVGDALESAETMAESE